MGIYRYEFTRERGREVGGQNYDLFIWLRTYCVVKLETVLVYMYINCIYVFV